MLAYLSNMLCKCSYDCALTRANELKPQKRFKVFWSEAAQREALETIGKKLGVKELDDWHSMRAVDLKKELIFISTIYKNSLFNTLKTLYPQHNWDPLRFSKVPQGYWDDENSQRNALERVGRDLGVKQLDDWYTVSTSTVKNRLSFIKTNYNGSVFLALKTLYPHHNWDPLHPLSKQVPRGYWSNTKTRREALERFGRERLGVKQLDDWYNVPSALVTKELSFLGYHYNNSLFGALEDLFPEHDWNPLRFPQPPQRFWKKPSTLKHFHHLFTKWKKKHNIQHLQDWYELPPNKVKLFQRASRCLFGGVTKMLNEWFPDKKNWVRELQASTPEVDLQMMLELVSDIDVHRKIGSYSVDIFIPEWSIALEYQGIQHFKQSWRGDFKSQRLRDEEKQSYSLKQSKPVTLVPISYNWNGTWAQLKSTLQQLQSMR